MPNLRCQGRSEAGTDPTPRWECVARANDPTTFTKTWTSDDVPGGLVRTQQQSHSQIVGQPYRDIQQTLFAPIDGVEPQLLGDAAPPASPNRGTTPPATPAQPAPAPVAPPRRGRSD